MKSPKKIVSAFLIAIGVMSIAMTDMKYEEDIDAGRFFSLNAPFNPYDINRICDKLGFIKGKTTYDESKKYLLARISHFDNSQQKENIKNVITIEISIEKQETVYQYVYFFRFDNNHLFQSAGVVLGTIDKCSGKSGNQ